MNIKKMKLINNRVVPILPNNDTKNSVLVIPIPPVVFES